MMPFSIGTGLERVDCVRPELGLLLGRFAGSKRWTPLQKQERKRISGVRLLLLRCLSQFLPERKVQLLRGGMFLRTGEI